MAKVNLTFLNDLVQAITRTERRGRGKGQLTAQNLLTRPAAERLAAACDVLMGRIGEAARIAVAEQALAAYAELGADEQRDFFALLCDRFGADPEPIRAAYAAYDADPSAGNLARLFEVVEPRRQTLLRRLNMAPGATLKLVAMRADLLAAIASDSSLAPIDSDFAHLLGSWFNRGFLYLERIDWSTPAAILEKIIAYESVHRIADWDDLRRRLDQADRRCYAFFHPATGNEPLIFVEVALTRAIPDAIAPILTAPRLDAPRLDVPADADTAVFYSINNSLPGLKGVSFGNLLIKQVVAVLQAELPQLKTFVTLSPAPGFGAWLSRASEPRAVALRAELEQSGWQGDPAQVERLRPEVEAVAAHYFTEAKSRGGAPFDPVARFHLGNGAAAWRVNWPADLAPGAVQRAHALMINYLYDPTAIETQHEAFMRDGTVATGAPLAAVLAR